MSNGQWCPLARFLEVAGDRWSLQIIRELASGSCRFKALKNNISGISMDQLTRKLDDLCANRLIVRQGFAESPPRVEYQLTEKGKTLIPVLRRILVWGFENIWNEPKVSENVEIATSLKTMAHFFGTASGSILFRMAPEEIFFVERYEDGKVSVLTSEELLFERVQPDVIVDVSLAEWIRITSERPSTSKGLRVRGEFTGRENILTKVFPLLSGATWLGDARFPADFDFVQEAWPKRRATNAQMATPTKIR